MDKISSVIRQVADEEILPRFKNLKEHEVCFKETDEFVTEADIEAERSITEKLLFLYPNSIVTGEEDIAKNPARLDELIKSDCGFLIDPIDGTNNFIKGDERFAIMIVALQYGEAAASWIYVPTKNMFAVAEKGGGAFINGQKITLKAPITDISEMTGAVHITRMPKELRVETATKLKAFRENRPAYCAGYDYICLLNGRKDFSVYYRTLLWDHLPGTLLYKEAGGYVRDLDGRTYTPRNDGTGLLCAANEDIWLKIKDKFF